MSEIIKYLIFLGVIYLALKLYNRIQVKRGYKLIRIINDYLENYELLIHKDLEIYRRDLIVIHYKHEQKIVKKTDFYLSADISGAFIKIKRPIISDVSKKLFNYDGKSINGDYYKRLKSIFYSQNEKDKLSYFNKEIEIKAIDVAVENSFALDEKVDSVGRGAKFIALRAFNLETSLVNCYPEYNYRNLMKLLKKRKKNSDLSPVEFWEMIN